ncbi:FAD dependent oxidoreductase [Poronia punctata]|nr:FAD dependent oxidoreductase [Poronia punctata]
MDQRASLPVSLPRENPTQSYWQTPPDPEISSLRTTESLPADAEIVIIGSGITGAAVAYNLLSNGARNVVMLEARGACSGATGRNGGHTKAASYRTFPHHAHHHGPSTAAQIARLELSNIRAVHAFAAEHSIPCDSHPCETVDVVYSSTQWSLDQAAITELRAALDDDDDDDTGKYTFLTPEQVAKRFHCGEENEEENEKEKVAGGIVYEAGSIDAYRFTIGLLKLCLEMGLNLQTFTPVTSITKQQQQQSGNDSNNRNTWSIQTSRGTILSTKRLILATNGYTAHLVDRFRGVIVPLRGHVTAQRPGSDMPNKGTGLDATYSFIYEGGYDYMITKPKGSRFEGDLIIGGRLTSAECEGLYEYGTTDDTTEDEDIMRSLRDSLPGYFGENWGDDHPDGRVRRQWTGIMGYGPDGLPFVGEMPGEEGKGLWIAAGFQGHGMVLCWMCAKALVEMMEGRDDENLRSWFPDVFRVAQERFETRFQGRLLGRKDPVAL